MKILLHDRLLPAAEVALTPDNRAFRYGDGFFETIVADRGALRFWPHHWARIQRGAAALQLSLPAKLATHLPALLTSLLAANGLLGGPARLRWQGWRAGAGLYSPQQNDLTWLATAEPLAALDHTTPLGPAAFATTVRTAPSVLSGLKGPNAALYTLAALEKQARGLDELLLLSPAGHVAEAVAAAVVWVQGRTLFAPDAAATGAVAGVRLAHLLTQARAAGWRVETGQFSPAALLTAEAAATVSVTGVRWLTQLGARRYAPQPAQAAVTALAK